MSFILRAIYVRLSYDPGRDQPCAGQENCPSCRPAENIRPSPINTITHDLAVVRHQHDQKQQGRGRKTLHDARPDEGLHRIESYEVQRGGDQCESRDDQVEFFRLPAS